MLYISHDYNVMYMLIQVSPISPIVCNIQSKWSLRELEGMSSRVDTVVATTAPRATSIENEMKVHI